MHAPITKLSIKGKKNLEKSWLTKGILLSIKQKNIIYHKFIRSKEGTSKQAFLQELKYYKNFINKQELIRQIFARHSLRNTKMIPKEHGME